MYCPSAIVNLCSCIHTFRGADISFRDRTKRTPFMIAKENVRYIFLYEMLDKLKHTTELCAVVSNDIIDQLRVWLHLRKL